MSMIVRKRLFASVAVVTLGIAIGVWFFTRMDPTPPVTSMINLIANPRMYDGKYIAVYGVLGMDDVEGLMFLFLSEDFLNVWDLSNAFNLYLFDREMEKKSMGLVGKHVFVRGYFTRNRDFRSRSNPGRITEATVDNYQYNPASE